MRVRFLGAALFTCVFCIAGSAIAQRWGVTRPPESWTFLGYADSQYYSDAGQSEGKARFFVQSTDDPSMPLPAGIHNWAGIIVFDEEQRSRDGRLYWQRGIAGGVFCDRNQIIVNVVHLLDKEGNILVDDWIDGAKPVPVSSDTDKKIYDFACHK